MKKQHQFVYIQDGDSRHIGFWPPGVFDSKHVLSFKVSTLIHTKFGDIWSK